jgi:hypothetical protein
MNLSEFYDHVVLRDLLEYTAPGIVVLIKTATGMELASYALTHGLMIVPFVVAHPWHGLIALLFFGYVIGHILTAVHGLISREALRSEEASKSGKDKPRKPLRIFKFLKQEDTNLVADTFKQTSWFASRVSGLMRKQLNIQPADAEKLLLSDSKDSRIFREIIRGIVQLQVPELYREHVNRHSVVSRFCQNMAIAIVIVLVAFALGWGTLMLSRPFDRLSWLALVVGLTLIFDGMISVAALWKRAERLRRTMIRHTFELLCLGNSSGKKTPPAELS